MRQTHSRGTTLIEVMLSTGVFIVLMGMAIPLLLTGHESSQMLAAARYLSGQAMLAQSRAVRSGAAVGLQFKEGEGGYEVRTYVDGDGDGIRSADIANGVDHPLQPSGRLRDVYPSVRLGLDPSVPPVGEIRMSGPQADPVRFCRGDILTFSPLGTASSGTLYLRASRSGEQYAVRVLGVTGRVRVLRFESAAGTWIER